MAAGIAIGYYSPAVPMMITNFPMGNSSIQIAIGLILMMYLRLRFKKFGIWCGEGEYDVSVSYRINQKNDYTGNQ